MSNQIESTDEQGQPGQPLRPSPWRAGGAGRRIDQAAALLNAALVWPSAGNRA